MSGTFASIEKRIDRNGYCLAYKTYSKSHGRLVYRHYERELRTLKKLAISDKETSKTHHIVQWINMQETSTSFQLIFPYYNSTLTDRLGNKDAALGYSFLSQITKGLSYIHERGIIHCDLSPSNILVDDITGNMFICDFGCAHSILDEEIEPYKEVGTRYYKAPEHLFGSKRYAPSTDIWSLGSIFAQIFVGYPIFAGESDIEQIGRIFSRLGKPDSKVEQEEMNHLPDANKLMFYTSDISDDEFEFDSDDEDEEIKAIRESKRSIFEIMDENACITDNDRRLIMGMLTWSIKERLTIPEIMTLSESKNS